MVARCTAPCVGADVVDVHVDDLFEVVDREAGIGLSQLLGPSSVDQQLEGVAEFERRLACGRIAAGEQLLEPDLVR